MTLEHSEPVLENQPAIPAADIRLISKLYSTFVGGFTSFYKFMDVLLCHREWAVLDGMGVVFEVCEACSRHSVILMQLLECEFAILTRLNQLARTLHNFQVSQYKTAAVP